MERRAIEGELHVVADVPGMDALRGPAGANFTLLEDLDDFNGAVLVTRFDVDTVVVMTRSVAVFESLHVRAPIGSYESYPNVARFKVQLVLYGDGSIRLDIRPPPPAKTALKVAARATAEQAAAYLAETGNPPPAHQVVASTPMRRPVYLAHNPRCDGHVYIVDLVHGFLPDAAELEDAGELHVGWHIYAAQEHPPEGVAVEEGAAYPALLASHAVAHPKGDKLHSAGDTKSPSGSAALWGRQMGVFQERLYDATAAAAYAETRKLEFLQKWTERRERPAAEFEAHWEETQARFAERREPGATGYVMVRQLHRAGTDDAFFSDSVTDGIRGIIADSVAATAAERSLEGLNLKVQCEPGARLVEVATTVGFEVDIQRRTFAGLVPVVDGGEVWPGAGMVSRLSVALDIEMAAPFAASGVVRSAVGERLCFYPQYGNMSRTSGPCALFCSAGMPLDPSLAMDAAMLAPFTAGRVDDDGRMLRTSSILYATPLRRGWDPKHTVFGEAESMKKTMDAFGGQEAALADLDKHWGKYGDSVVRTADNMSMAYALRGERVNVIALETDVDMSKEAHTAALKAEMLPEVKALANLRMEAMVRIFDGGAWKEYFRQYVGALVALIRFYITRTKCAAQAAMFGLLGQGTIMFILEGFQRSRTLPHLAYRMAKQMFVTASTVGFPFLSRPMLAGLGVMELISRDPATDGLFRLTERDACSEAVRLTGRRIMHAQGGGDARSPAARSQLFRRTWTTVLCWVDPVQWPQLYAGVRGAQLLLDLCHSSLTVHADVVMAREARGRHRATLGASVAKIKVVGQDGEVLTRFHCGFSHRLPLANLVSPANSYRLAMLLPDMHRAAVGVLTPVEATAVIVKDVSQRMQRLRLSGARSTARSAFISVAEGTLAALEEVAQYVSGGLTPSDRSMLAMDIFGDMDVEVTNRRAAVLVHTAKGWQMRRLDGLEVDDSAEAAAPPWEDSELIPVLRDAQLRFRDALVPEDPIQPIAMALETEDGALATFQAALGTMVETQLKYSMRLAGESTVTVRDDVFTRDAEGDLVVATHDDEATDYSTDEEVFEGQVMQFEETSGDETPSEDASEEAAIEEFLDDTTSSGSGDDSDTTEGSGGSGGGGGGAGGGDEAAQDEDEEEAEEDQAEEGAQSDDEMEEAPAAEQEEAEADEDEAGPSTAVGRRRSARERRAPAAFSPGAARGRQSGRGGRRRQQASRGARRGQKRRRSARRQ